MLRGSHHPHAQIASDYLRAKLYLPDARNGFYRGTRFDWSGVISSLEYQGRQYYGPWYTKYIPTVHDFIYNGADIVAGAQSAITGPAEEFPRPQGYDTAKVGETFVKIGVGVLRKRGECPYNCYEDYELVDAGAWTTCAGAESVEFVQEVTDARTGCGYEYRKTIRLIPTRPELRIEHCLKNTGRVPIETDQYNHNFLTFGGDQVGPDVVLTFPFQIEPRPTADGGLATVKDNQIGFISPLANQDVVAFPVLGFGGEVRDYNIRVENRKVGAGVRITGNRPLTRLALWSIRSVLSIEPFIDVSTRPGRVTSWTYTYTYDVLDR